MGRYLSEFVQGGIDGSITTFAIVSGTIGAGLPLGVITILGLANVVADGLSMAASRYMSSKTEREQGILNVKKTPEMAALVTFLSFVAIGLIPITVFMFTYFTARKSNDTRLYYISFLLTMLALFLVGYVKGSVLKQNRMKTGLNTLLIGSLAGIISFGIGRVVRKTHETDFVAGKNIREIL